MFDLSESKIYQKLIDNRIIFLSGEIDDELASKIVAKLLYLDSLSNEDIVIYINSPGGSVTSGLMIYDTIRYLKSDVSTIGIGLAASMASILLMCGTKGKRKILPHAKVMLHELSTNTGGKISDILVAATEAKKTNEVLYKIIIDNSNLDYSQIKNLNMDLWLDSNMALKYGIVDKVIC